MSSWHPQVARDLLRVDQKQPVTYQQHAFSLPHLTAYTIHWLITWEIPTTYENITVLNSRLFRAEFTLVGFPEFPDAMRTNRTLLQMRPKYRGFATSDPRRGVFLTQKGREAAARVLRAVGAPEVAGEVVKDTSVELHVTELSQRGRTRDPRQIIREAKQKLLFRRYEDGTLAEADVVHLLGLLSLYDHTPSKEVKRALRELRNDATSINDDSFISFLDAIEQRFHSYLNRA